MGDPAEVVEKIVRTRDSVGAYQPQISTVGFGGWAGRMVLDQIELFGTDVVRVLRRDLASSEPPERQPPDTLDHRS